MRRFGVICLGVLCAGATLASSASANEYPVTALPQVGRCVSAPSGGEWSGPTCTSLNTAHGKWKWEEGAGAKKKFSGTGEITLLETANSAHLISCSGLTYEGEYTSSKAAKVTIDLIGCTLPATSQKCQSNPIPQKEGEIETTLEAKPGFIRVAKPIAGWDLTGWNVTVTCGTVPETNILTDKISGSVIGAVSKTGKMLEEETIKFKETGGKQSPEHFEGEPNDVLSSEFTSGLTKTTEQTGMRSTIVYENEEPLEIKVKCNHNHAPCT